MSVLARNRRLMYAYAGIKTLGNSVTFVFGTILVFQALGIWAMAGYGLAWVAGGLAASFALVPAARRFPLRGLCVLGLGLLAGGYGLMASGWALASPLPLLAVGFLQGLGMETVLWSQEVLFKSATEDGEAGSSSAAFLNVLTLAAALAPALLGGMAATRGLDWAVGIAAGLYALAAIPLAFYHEGHLAEHLPASDSLLAEWRRVRREYAFRSDAWRWAYDGMQVEAYLACVLLLLFLDNARSVAVVGYVMGGATFLSLAIQWLKGRRFDEGRGCDLPRSTTLAAQAVAVARPLLAGSPLAFGIADATARVLWSATQVVAAAHVTRNMRALGGASYMALLHAAGRLLVLPFYAAFAGLLLAGVPLRAALLVLAVGVAVLGLPYGELLNRQSEHQPASPREPRSRGRGQR